MKKLRIAALALIASLVPIAAVPQSTSLDNSVKLSDITFINQPSFGAKCDGSTDDRAAIQAALDSGAKFIYGVAGATCLVNKSSSTKTILGVAYPFALAIPPGVVLDCQGGTIKLANSQNSIILINKNAGSSTDSDIGIRNCIFDGNYTNQTTPASGEMSNVMLWGALRPRLENIRAINARQYCGRFLNIDTGYFNQLRCETSYGDCWSFGISASSQPVVRSFGDNIYGENCLGSFGTLQGNPWIGVVQNSTFGKIIGKDSHGGLKIQDDSQYSSFGQMIFIGQTNGSTNSGTKVQGNTGAGTYPIGISIGQVISQNAYGNGLHITAIKSVSIGEYIGYSNATGAGSAGSDKLDANINTNDAAGLASVQISSLKIDSPGAQCMRVNAATAPTSSVDIGSVFCHNPTGEGVLLPLDPGTWLTIGRISVHDDASGMTYAVKVTSTSGARGTIGSIETNKTHSTTQSRVLLPDAGTPDFTINEIRLGSTDKLEAVVQLSNGATSTAVTNGHVWREYIGGASDYFHPIIAVLPWNSSAATLVGTAQFRVVVTDGSAGTGFTINHPAAGASDFVMYKILGWKAVTLNGS